MNNELYLLIPMVSLTMLVMSISTKLYKRSVSAFISLITFAITSNCMFYGYIDNGLIVLLIGMSIMFYRAMLKPANGTFFVNTYRGIERRNRRYK